MGGPAPPGGEHLAPLVSDDEVRALGVEARPRPESGEASQKALKRPPSGGLLNCSSGRERKEGSGSPRAVLALLAVGAAWFARQNHFEWMFNPLSRPTYAPATLVDFADDRDMVVAIEIQGEAVAYPVRQMAYHHVVQDTVGGVPVASTY